LAIQSRAASQKGSRNLRLLEILKNLGNWQNIRRHQQQQESSRLRARCKIACFMKFLIKRQKKLFESEYEKQIFPNAFKDWNFFLKKKYQFIFLLFYFCEKALSDILFIVALFLEF
jgi:hypothetical protein